MIMACIHVTAATLLLFNVINLASAEFIFRGACTRIFQPQEVAITVDTNDVVFSLYVIPPRNKPVNSSEHCQSECLSFVNPPCRSAIYDPEQRSCWLLRAEKQMALEFDTRTGNSLLYGILIAPQTLMDGAIDRLQGVPGCNSFCPAPGVQSADTITPICIQDCANTSPACAGELSNCMDVARGVSAVHVGYAFGISSGQIPYTLTTLTITKKYDYTSLRITYQLGSWNLNPGSTLGYTTEGYIYATVNGVTCTGEAGEAHMVYRQVLEGYTTTYRAEPSHGEFSCTYYDTPRGTYDVKLIYDYRRWGGTFGSLVSPGLSLPGSDAAPSLIHVEEYVPARNGPFKLDDMARCQSATVFNSQSVQWASESNPNVVGRTTFAVYKYKKRSDTSILRIFWNGQIWWDANQKTIRLYFTINDQPCTNPQPIETCQRDFNYVTGTSRHAPNSHTTPVDGICRGLPAGRYDIVLWVDKTCSYYGNNDNYLSYNIGYGKPATMIVEEINEGLPINALLLSDGTLMSLPYFNRQYFVFTTACEDYAGAACHDPFYTHTYGKLRAESFLHIKWFGTQELCTAGSGSYTDSVKFFVKINGADCSNPLKISTMWYVNNMPGGQCDLRPKIVEGVCKTALPAGSVTITLAIGRAAVGWGNYNRKYAAGNGGTSYLMVEEVYDSNIN